VQNERLTAVLMNEAKLWDGARCCNGDGSSGLDRAGGVVDSLIGNIGRGWVVAIISAAMPGVSNSLVRSLVGALQSRPFHAAQHIERPCPYNLAKADLVHLPRHGDAGFVIGP